MVHTKLNHMIPHNEFKGRVGMSKIVQFTVNQTKFIAIIEYLIQKLSTKLHKQWRPTMKARKKE
jgi:hypothetical protein